MRITYKKSKSTVLRDKTMQQLRELRTKFEGEHPELMARIQEEVRKQQIMALPPLKADMDDTVIDRKKNLGTILKFAESYEGSPEFRDQLKKLLIQNIEV